MKKYVLLFPILLTLVGCGGGGEAPQDPELFEINYNNNTFFEASSIYHEAIEGEKIQFSYNLNSSLRDFDDLISITNVKANGIDVSPSTDNFYDYEFIMPGREVSITYDVEINEQLTASSDMAFSFICDEVSRPNPNPEPYETEFKQRYDVTFGSSPIIANTDTDGYLMSVEAIAFNEDGIIKDLIGGCCRDNWQSAYVSSTYFELDLTKLEDVEDFYIGIVANNRVLLKHIDVVDYGMVYDDRVNYITVNLDISKLSDEYKNGNLRLFYELNSSNSIYGLAYSESSFFEVDITKLTYRFSVAEGSYNIWLAYGKTNDYGIYAYYPLTNNGDDKYLVNT